MGDMGWSSAPPGPTFYAVTWYWGDRGINSGLISSGKDRGINFRMWLRHHKDGLHLAKQVELNDHVFSRTREGYKKWLYLNLALA